ncbi:MAG: NAD(P)-dependent oxidoreductase [Marinilabiliaceae bacterium]|jgi:alanine dehydrogenase|nr:NAD(P)-dependent oxidoreductase [Marinilabiliaceae bacterium]
MLRRLKIGILRETKNPPDKRVPLTPSQIINLQIEYPDVEFVVQPSDYRCYKDEEYRYLEIPLKEDLSDCDILMGVKEVEKSTFIPGKTYLFFAHVAKEQSYNREMLQKMIEQKIRLVDYEYLTRDNGARVVAFGRWAGIVGAYNGLRARGIRTDRFSLKPCHECHDLEEVWAGLKMIDLIPGLKILVTGDGRVGNGAMETLNQTNAVQVSPRDFLTKNFDVPVVCQLNPGDYVKHVDGKKFDLRHFFENPKEYVSAFKPYTEVADIYIAAHFWDPDSPKFITGADLKDEKFNISVIADVSCDIDGPIASTLRATTIADPFYGYNRTTGKEEPAFKKEGNITVMSVDNLPGELPRDASSDFGEQLTEYVLPDLIFGRKDGMIKRATICENGELTDDYKYLTGYLAGKQGG